MVEVIRSMTGLSWAMMLFGVRQLGNLLAADADRGAAALDGVARAARSHLGKNMGRIYRAGERRQSAAVDRLFDAMTPDLPRLSLAMLEQSAAILGMFSEQGRAGRELANRVQAFRDFQFVESRLGLPEAMPLAPRLEKAATLDPYRRLWAIEGLGFAHAERAWRGGRAPRSLLRPGTFPARALIPLHTGMGLSLASRTLAAIDTRDGEGRLRDALEQLGALHQANSIPGCEPMVFEALGLVVRTLHPHLLGRVDRLLITIDPEFAALYWHGVGRALYFVPSHALPGLGARGRALVKARREAAHPTGRQNALAGFAWAVTLVNFRHPEVLESLLRDHAARIFDRPAFAHGVSSAILLWYGVNGREPHLEGLLGHRPGRPTAALWQRLVTDPGETALRSYSTLEQGRALGTLFRYQAPDGDTPPGGRRRCREPALPTLSRTVDGWISRAFQCFNQVGQRGGP